MTAFLAEVGTKLADRWAAALVVPGLLFLAAIALAVRLGQGNALNAAALQAAANAVAAAPASHSTGAVLVSAAGVLAASVAIALLASVLGSVVEYAWLLPGNWPPGRFLRARRTRRWLSADDLVRAAENAAFAGPASDAAADPPSGLPDAGPSLADAIATRDAISLVDAGRPTWAADRLRSLHQRVWRAYQLDLTVAWPRLWALASAQLRADVTAASDSYVSAFRLLGWGLLYLVLAPWWWPSALIAVVTVAVGWVRVRSATEALASLVETTVDLGGRDLALSLGLECDGPLEAATGRKITARLRKDQPARRSGLA